jgi:hypothetical protein
MKIDSSQTCILMCTNAQTFVSLIKFVTDTSILGVQPADMCNHPATSIFSKQVIQFCPADKSRCHISGSTDSIEEAKC